MPNDPLNRYMGLFQSLTGRLKTRLGRVEAFGIGRFQSLTGRLKTASARVLTRRDSIVSIPHR